MIKKFRASIQDRGTGFALLNRERPGQARGPAPTCLHFNLNSK